jgi:hypothetical protein
MSTVAGEFGILRGILAFASSLPQLFEIGQWRLSDFERLTIKTTRIYPQSLRSARESTVVWILPLWAT